MKQEFDLRNLRAFQNISTAGASAFILYILPVLSFYVFMKNCDNYVTPMETGLSATVPVLLIIAYSMNNKTGITKPFSISILLFPIFIVLRFLSIFKSPHFYYSLFNFNNYLTMLFIYIYFMLIPTARRDRISVIVMFLIFSFLLSIHGVFQYYGIDLTRQTSRYVDSSNPALHVFSIFGNSNLLAAFLAVLSGPALALFIHAKRTALKALCCISFLSIFIAIFLCGARSALIAVSFSSFIVVITSLRNKKAAANAFTGILIFLLIAFSAYYVSTNHVKAKSRSLVLRSIYLKSSINMIKDIPLGSGNDTFKVRYPDYQTEFLKNNDDTSLNLSKLVNIEKPGHPHNEFLFLFVESGPLSSLVFLLILLFPVWRLFVRRELETIIYASMAISYGIISFMGFPLLIPLTAMLLPILISLSNVSFYEGKETNNEYENSNSISTKIFLIIAMSVMAALISFISYSKHNSNIHLTGAKRALVNDNMNLANMEVIESLRFNKSNDEALFTAGVLDLRKGKYEEALEYFNKATKTSSDKNLLKNKAMALMRLNEYNKSEALLLEVEDAYPADMDIKMMLLDIYLKTGKFRMAEKIADSGLAIYPENEYLKTMKIKLDEYFRENGK